MHSKRYCAHAIILNMDFYSLCFGKCFDNMLIFYRADEWDINKWAWDGVLKVVGKGEVCIIRLEDKTTGTIFLI